MSGLVEAARFNWAYQADLFRIFLEQNGVEAVVFDRQASFYADGAITGVRVMVLEKDLPEARRLFRNYDV